MIYKFSTNGWKQYTQQSTVNNQQSTQFSTNGWKLISMCIYIYIFFNFFNAVQQLNQNVAPFACFLSY